jgi:hypothetical protein
MGWEYGFVVEYLPSMWNFDFIPQYKEGRKGGTEGKERGSGGGDVGLCRVNSSFEMTSFDELQISFLKVTGFNEKVNA